MARVVLRNGSEKSPFLTCLAAALTTAIGTSPASSVPTSESPNAEAAAAPEGSFQAVPEPPPSEEDPSRSPSELCADDWSAWTAPWSAPSATGGRSSELPSCPLASA